jgi:hypothetical protein
MIWRKTVHFFQARSMVIPIERGVAIASTMKSIRVAAGAAAAFGVAQSARPVRRFASRVLHKRCAKSVGRIV